ncbi:glycosyltransferase family 4 protein [Flavobacterium amniphilum]|uniref:glycosyltransferase family 4 protein n=1 Tax=Flavobacterium amniphilum TaxID=1834035 RepID=UPI00202A5522|nr:glycosyltransferase family 4 protein [Flavobacterium amniphilum]MCL9805096.1 glycosyltransferase family 4 protein [Flavobacterium amniphilum]
MHICFLTHEYPKSGFPHGGLGSFVKTMAEALVNANVKVSVVGLNYTLMDEFSVENGVAIHRIRRNRSKGISWLLNSQALTKKIKEIHAENSIHILESPELDLAFIPKIKGIKYLIRLHGGHHFFAEGENRGINWWKGFQEKRSFAHADAFIAVSDYVKNHTAKYLDYYGKPLQVIFNPVNLSVFSPKDVGIEATNITFAGSVCEKKGVRQLIQAFGIVKKEFPDMRLNIYGRDWFFPDGSSYMEMLKKEVLPTIVPFDTDVVFHGAKEYGEIPFVYAKAKLCVFPSHIETLGLVAPEAMAVGKMVIFTEKGPGPEVIRHGENGLLCNPLDPNDIAEKLIWALKNEEKIVQIGEEARKSVLNRFELSKLVLENLQFYKSIV